MTLEELKAEAKKHGYKLVKETPNTTLNSCICGEKRYIRMLGTHTKYCKCIKCGFTADEAKYQYEAKIKWNKCVVNAEREATK
jgi:hypothetical protein